MAEKYAWLKTFTIRKKNILKETQQEAETKVKQGSESLRTETYDDSRLEPTFNENTCRRNLIVSRSGRFKEKRRVRGTLPANCNFYDSSAAVAK